MFADVDIVGVTGSIPVAPTISLNGLRPDASRPDIGAKIAENAARLSAVFHIIAAGPAIIAAVSPHAIKMHPITWLHFSPPKQIRRRYQPLDGAERGKLRLTVVLTDTQANPRSAGDLLSSIEITPSGSLGAPTLASQNGSLIDVTPGAATGTPVAGNPTHWGVGTSGGQIVLKTAGPFAVGESQ